MQKLKKKHILIAEDEKSLSRAMKLRLQKSGYEVSVADNGKLAKLQLDKQPYDLLLLDLIMPVQDGFAVLDYIHLQNYKMPVMNGEEMLDLLRKDTWGAEVPVIILSNVSKTADVTRNVSRVVDGKQLNDYFVKADTSIEAIAQLVTEKLGV